MLWQIVIAAVAAFVAGCLAGGSFVYVRNLKKWHSDDMDAVLGQVERIDSNMSRLNRNMEKAVTRFGAYSDRFETGISDASESMRALRASTSRALDEITASQRGLAPALEDLKSIEISTGENVERVLERVKLLG